MRNLAFVILIISCLHTAAFPQQSTIDSLLLLLERSMDDSVKVKLYNELVWVVYYSDPQEAKIYAVKAIKLAEKINYRQGLSEALNKMGIIEKALGNYDHAIDYYKRSLLIAEKDKDSISLAMTYNNLGNVHKSKGDYSSALNSLLKSLEISEKTGQEGGVADALMNIGLIYDDIGNDSLALENMEKSLKVAEERNDKSRISRALQNIANILSEGTKEEQNRSLELYNKALQINMEIGELRSQSMCLNNIGSVYFDFGEWQKAAGYYEKSLEIKEKIGDIRGKGVIFENLALIEQKKKDYKKATFFFSKALAIADSIEDAELQKNLLKCTADNYYLMGDYRASSDAWKLLLELNDSIFHSDMTAQITEMQAKYESEKKEAEIQRQKLEIDKQSAENRMQRIVIFSVIGGLLLLLFGLVVLFRMFRQKKLANALLSQQKEEITAQRDEIEAQRDLIMEQNQDITDSIEYAQKIQKAIFPDPENTSLFLKDHFILYKPRDIVSGDFYWINKIENKIIVIASDCTGHGVPGAFMSMLGVAFLNEIVNKERISSPAKILDRLRENIILALQQHGTKAEQRDGMDVAVISVDRNTNDLEYSGANNPLFIIRNGELMEIKADKMPVSIYPKMSPFTNNSYSLKPGDILYIFSDGFSDQFGGEYGKKLKTKNFKQLLLDICNRPMKEQEKMLDEFFIDWKGSFNQIDDVLVIGVRIN